MSKITRATMLREMKTLLEGESGDVSSDISLDAILQQIVTDETCTFSDYKLMHQLSVRHWDTFWKQLARRNLVYFSEPPGAVWNGEAFSQVDDVDGNTLRFMPGAKVNACYNLLDWNIKKGLGDKSALFYMGTNWKNDGIQEISYLQLKREVCKVSDFLERHLGVDVADCVMLYLPNCPQLVYFILACFRVGAVPAVVYRNTEKDLLKKLIDECRPKAVITTCKASGQEETLADSLLEVLKLQFAESKVEVIVIDLDDTYFDGTATGHPSSKDVGIQSSLKCLLNKDLHLRYRAIIIGSEDIQHECKLVDADHPLFIACTSGSTGAPKIIEHRTLGYLLNVVAVFKYMHLFQLEGPLSSAVKLKQDVSFCLPTLAWLYGMHSLLIGPLLTGGATVVYEHGTNEEHLVTTVREIIDKVNVTHLFTVPHFLSGFVKDASSYKVQQQLSSLRYVATAGSAVSEAIRRRMKGFFQWREIYHADTYAQTEAGTCLLTTPPPHFHLEDRKMIPFFGIDATVLTDGYEMQMDVESEGDLVIRQPWPGVFTRFLESSSTHLTKIFSRKSGVYHTGEFAIRQLDGSFIIKGRIDNSVDVVGNTEYRPRVLQLERVEELLEESEWVKEAMVCRWRTDRTDTMVVPGLMAVIELSQQNLFIEARHSYNDYDYRKHLQYIAPQLDSTVKDGVVAGRDQPLLSCLLFSKESFYTSAGHGKKDRRRFGQAVHEIIHKFSKDLTEEEFKRSLTQGQIRQNLKELLHDQDLEVVQLEFWLSQADQRRSTIG